MEKRPSSQGVASSLNMDQWNRVVDRLVKKGLLSLVDPTSLLVHLQQGGLSMYEKQVVIAEITDPQKMSKLERFIRARPSLQETLGAGLKEQKSPLLQVLSDAIDEVRNTTDEVEPEELVRVVLRQHDTAISSLAEWAVPQLRQVNCLTRSDEDDVNSGRRRIVDILADKSMEQWRMMMTFLKAEQKDLFSILEKYIDQRDPSLGESSSEWSRVGTADAAVQVSVPTVDAGAGSEMELFERIDIRVSLSRMEVLLHSASPDDTLGSVVDALRRCGRLMGVADVRPERVGSLAAPGWRWQTLAGCGLGPGATLQILPVRPAAVRVELFAPTCSASVQAKTIRSQRLESSALDKMLASSHNETLGSGSVVQQLRCLYARDGVERRAVFSFDEERSVSLLVDEDDGEEVADEQMTHVVREFVFFTTVRAAVSHIPLLHVYAFAEALIVDASGELRPTAMEALMFPRAVVHCRALRLQNRGRETLAFMLRLASGRYANVETGQLFEDSGAAVASRPQGDGTWSRSFLLLDTDSLIPHFRIPDGEAALLYTRAGTAVAVEGRRLTCRRAAPVDAGSVWVEPRGPWRLQEDVVAAMRRPRGQKEDDLQRGSGFMSADP